MSTGNGPNNTQMCHYSSTALSTFSTAHFHPTYTSRCLIACHRNSKNQCELPKNREQSSTVNRLCLRSAQRHYSVVVDCCTSVRPKTPVEPHRLAENHVNPNAARNFPSIRRIAANSPKSLHFAMASVRQTHRTILSQHRTIAPVCVSVYCINHSGPCTMIVGW